MLALAALAVGFLLETFVFRLVASAGGIAIRSLRGRRSAPWDAVREVRFVETSADSRYVIHTQTRDVDAAFHVIIETEDWTWNCNRLMSDIDQLVRVLVANRMVDPAADSSIAEHPPSEDQAEVDSSDIDSSHVERAGAIRSSLEEALHVVLGGAHVLHGALALLVVLFIASLSLAASDRLPSSGHFFLDIVLVAIGILCILSGTLVLACKIRARRHPGVPREPSSYPEDVLLTFASAIGGCLLLCWFVPRLLDGGDDWWVDAILVAMGLFLTLGYVRDVLRLAARP